MSGISTRKTVNNSLTATRCQAHTRLGFFVFLVLMSLFTTPGRMRYLFVEPVACHDSFTI